MPCKYVLIYINCRNYIINLLLIFVEMHGNNLSKHMLAATTALKMSTIG